MELNKIRLNLKYLPDVIVEIIMGYNIKYNLIQKIKNDKCQTYYLKDLPNNTYVLISKSSFRLKIYDFNTDELLHIEDINKHVYEIEFYENYVILTNGNWYKYLYNTFTYKFIYNIQQTVNYTYPSYIADKFYMLSPCS